MADRVVNQLSQPSTESQVQSSTESPAQPTPISSVNTTSSTIQHKCAECAKEETEQTEEQPELMRKPIFESGSEPPEDQVQRKCASCGKEEQVQTKSEQPAESASPNLESRLSSSKGSGSPLSPDTQSSMESAMGADFSGVRVHTGSEAIQMNRELNAQAFTHGNDIYFGAGKYDAGSSGGQHLLAHELVHTVQQGGGSKLINNSDLNAGRISKSDSDEQGINADDYVDLFMEKIFQGVYNFIRTVVFRQYSAYTQWKVDGAEYLIYAVLSGVKNGNDIPKNIMRKILEPEKLNSLVDRGRYRYSKSFHHKETPDQIDTFETGQGPIEWFPDVGIEVANTLYRRINESLTRIVPRYIVAKYTAQNTAWASNRATDPSLKPEPQSQHVISSHPVDKLVINGLCTGKVLEVDLQGFREVNPDFEIPDQLVELRPVNFTFLGCKGLWFWLKVEDPKNATSEEVANALFGNSEFSYLLTSSVPYFGFKEVGYILDIHRESLKAQAADPDALESFHYPSAKEVAGTGARPFNLDPNQELLSSPFADEIALQQAGTVGAEGIGKNAIILKVRQNLLLMNDIIEKANQFGLGSKLTQAKQRLDDLGSNLADEVDETLVYPWDAHSVQQQILLTEILFGLQSVIDKLGEMTNLGANPYALNLPNHLRMAFHKIAESFTSAAATSHLVIVGKEKLGLANIELRDLPITMMEGILSVLRNQFVNVSESPKYNVEALKEREVNLRLKLSNIRVLLDSNPKLAQEQLSEVYQEISDFQLEAQMVVNMDALDDAWQALDDTDGFWAGVTFQSGDLEALQSEGQKWKKKWDTIYNLWKNGERESAKKQLDELRNNPQLQTYFSRVYEEIQDAESKKLIGKIIGMLAIALVTMGVGVLAEGVILGITGATSLSFGGSLAVAGIEALTFTTLSTIFYEKNPTVGGFLKEFAFNFMLFKALRIYSSWVRASRWVNAGATRLFVAEYAGPGIIIGASNIAKAAIESKMSDGQALSKEEIRDIAVESLAMYLAIVIIARTSIVRTRFLEPLKRVGGLLGEKAANAVALRNQVVITAEIVEANGNQELASEMINQERTAIELEEQALLEFENQASKDPSVIDLTGIDPVEAQEFLLQAAEHRGSLERTQLVMHLEQFGPNHFLAPPEKIPDILTRFKKLGGLVTDSQIDPITNLRTYRITYENGERVLVTEKNTENQLAENPSEELVWIDPEAKLFYRQSSETIQDAVRGRLAPRSEAEADSNLREVIEIDNTERIYTTEPEFNQSTGEWEWFLLDLETGAVIATQHTLPPEIPFSGPEMTLTPYDAFILETGRLVSLRSRGFRWTEVALQRMIAAYEAKFNQTPENLPGNIAWDNLANFQKEFVEIRNLNRDWSERLIAIEAVRRISFGRWRVKIGYGDIDVEIVDRGTEVIDGVAYENVPTWVNISARPFSSTQGK